MTWDTYKTTQDRGRKFQLDAMDVDEVRFIVNFISALNEFVARQGFYLIS